MLILVEIYTDSDTGKQMLIWKKEVLEARKNIFKTNCSFLVALKSFFCLASIIESDISMEDFELITDERTGEIVLRLKSDVAIRKGLTNLSETNFEYYTDPNTGQKGIRIKDNQNNKRINIIKDKITGQLIIRMIFDDNDQDNDDSNDDDDDVNEQTNEGNFFSN